MASVEALQHRLALAEREMAAMGQVIYTSNSTFTYTPYTLLKTIFVVAQAVEFAAEANGSLQKRLTVAKRTETELVEERSNMEQRLKAVPCSDILTPLR